MTLTDAYADEDLLLVPPTSPDSTKRSWREPPPGAEVMARPWRLGILGIGITIGLVARLLAANGYFGVTSDTMAIAAAATSALVGVGLLTLAAERDRFDRWMILLATATGLALGSLQWISPRFAAGTLEWDNSAQVAMAVLGTANGLVLAGVLTLAFVRRWPTMTVVGVLSAGVLTLTANTVLLRNEWPAIAALALAFGGVLLAWDQAPRHEPAYTAQDGSPRISRAALSLATVALGGSVIQIWLSRSTSIGRVLPAVVASIALVVLGFLAMIRLRREIQRRHTTLSEWTSWMREIRTGDLRTDFENLATSESGGVIGDVTGSDRRPLSFPDLRVDDGTTPFRAPPATGLETPAEGVPQIDTAGPGAPRPAADTPATGVPQIDIPVSEMPKFAVPDEPLLDTDAVAAPVGEPPDVQPPVEQPRAEQPRVEQPRLFGDEPPTAAEVLWAEDLAQAGEAEAPAPLIADDQPSLFDYELDAPRSAPAIPLPILDEPAPSPALTAPPSPSHSPAQEPSSARTSSSFSSLLDTEPVATGPATDPVAAAATEAATGAFSSWLDASGSTVVGLDSLVGWLAKAVVNDAPRLVAAIETMSLADFDELPVEVSQAANDAMLARLAAIAPRPTLVTAIDGPYLMVAWDRLDRDRLVNINRTILDAMATPVDTDLGAVALTGTLCLVRPEPGLDIDGLIDQSIQGLVRARQLEAVAIGRG